MKLTFLMSLAHLCSLIALIIAPVTAVQAQVGTEYPSKAIRLVVPFAPGGATDIIGRAVAKQLTEVLAQSVVVENQSGAGGIIGAANVVRAPADGYTLLLSSLSTLGLSSAELAYDPLKDLEQVSMIAYVPNVLVVHPDLPVDSVTDLIALARKKPGQILYGTGGAGTSVDLASELFNKLADVKLERVAYRGSGPALLDLVAGRVNLMFDNMPSAMPHVQRNALKAIAVTSAKRSSIYPDLPTIKESGVPEYDLIAWFGVSVPAGTPPEVIAKLHEAIKVAGSSSSFTGLLTSQGAEMVISTPQEFAAFFESEYSRFSQLMNTIKAQPK